MTSSFNWDQFEDAPTEFEWEKQESQPVSSARSLISAFPKGFIKGARGINPMFAFSSGISKKQGERSTETFLPTNEGFVENFLERAGKIAPVLIGGEGSILAKGAEAAGGALLGELAKESGLGEAGEFVSELVGMGLPGALKGVSNLAKKAIASPAEKMKSGLTKLKSVDAKKPSLGTISKERKDVVIEKLNKEAAGLAKQKINNHLPLAKKIEENFDFEKSLNQSFSNLTKAAEKANPRIDITPISNLTTNISKKYSGIPKLHPDAAKIVSEIKAFNKNPRTRLNHLLKIYRSNNIKRKNIFETSRLTGKQQEYVDFLGDFNRAIQESFEKTLPENSQWLNQFKNLNKEYSSWQNAKKTLDSLKGILNGNPTSSEIEKLAVNPKMQQKLNLSMGEEGANEIIQLANDLKQARVSLKNIPKSKLSKFDAAFPLYYLIPVIGKVLGLAKTVPAARYFYGWMLSTPKRTKLSREAINSFLNNDLKGYRDATTRLMQEYHEED